MRQESLEMYKDEYATGVSQQPPKRFKLLVKHVQKATQLVFSPL